MVRDRLESLEQLLLASADAFYNEPGVTSESLIGTPFVDPAVPLCGGGTTSSPPGGNGETTGGVAHTWTDYEDAGGFGSVDRCLPDCNYRMRKVTGFAVADGNTWWYQIASAPWSGAYYVSADAFYNDQAFRVGAF